MKQRQSELMSNTVHDARDHVKGIAIRNQVNKVYMLIIHALPRRSVK